MIKKILVPLFLLISTFTYAETIKTDVLVIGGGASGVAAAIQSARSKVKTLLVEPGPWLGGSMTMGGMCILDANRELPSGIWGEFRRKVTDHYRQRLGYDTAHNAILRFEPYTGAEILKKITDTVKNLTVKLKTPWTAIKKDGTGWEVTIVVNGEKVTVKAKVVVDGTETGEVAAKANVHFIDTGHGEGKEVMSEIVILKDYGRAADKTIAKPAGYNPNDYIYLKSKDLKKMLKNAAIPNDKYMIDWVELSKQIYAVKFTASAERFVILKDSIYREAKRQALGLVYYLQTELGYKNLGLDDQFNTPDHLPYIPFIKAGMKTEGTLTMVLDDILKPYDRESKLYRTSIAVGNAMPFEHPVSQGHSVYPPYSIPLGAIVPKNAENLLVTEKALSVSPDVNASTMNPAVQMTLGQGIGATAAYLAFFKTTTKNLNVRVIQGELLDYKGYLIPFTDIPHNDRHFRAIQQLGATGLLKGVQKINDNSSELLFDPDATVNTEEIKPVLLELYTRAFIWFNKEKPGDKFTLGNMLSGISDYTLTDPATLKMMIQNVWKTQLKLTGDFDVNRPITRREFAVLINRYMNPFSKTVDLSGNVVN